MHPRLHAFQGICLRTDRYDEKQAMTPTCKAVSIDWTVQKLAL